MSRMKSPPPNKGTKFPPEPLNREEVRRLLEACPRSVAGPRLARVDLAHELQQHLL